LLASRTVRFVLNVVNDSEAIKILLLISVPPNRVSQLERQLETDRQTGTCANTQTNTERNYSNNHTMYVRELRE